MYVFSVRKILCFSACSINLPLFWTNEPYLFPSLHFFLTSLSSSLYPSNLLLSSSLLSTILPPLSLWRLCVWDTKQSAVAPPLQSVSLPLRQLHPRQRAPPLGWWNKVAWHTWGCYPPHSLPLFSSRPLSFPPSMGVQSMPLPSPHLIGHLASLSPL